MASLYREPTLEHQIDLTLTRIIIGNTVSDYKINELELHSIEVSSLPYNSHLSALKHIHILIDTVYVG